MNKLRYYIEQWTNVNICAIDSDNVVIILRDSTTPPVTGSLVLGRVSYSFGPVLNINIVKINVTHSRCISSLWILMSFSSSNT